MGHRLNCLNKAPIATNVVCFSRLLKCLRSLYGKQCGPRSDCSNGSNLYLVHAVCFMPNSSAMLGNCLQQTISVDDIFRCIFFLGALRVKWLLFATEDFHIPTNSAGLPPITSRFVSYYQGLHFLNIFVRY